MALATLDPLCPPNPCNPDYARLVCRDRTLSCHLSHLARFSSVVRDNSSRRDCDGCGGRHGEQVCLLLPDFGSRLTEKILRWAIDGDVVMHFSEFQEATSLLELLGGSREALEGASGVKEEEEAGRSCKYCHGKLNTATGDACARCQSLFRVRGDVAGLKEEAQSTGDQDEWADDTSEELPMMQVEAQYDDDRGEENGNYPEFQVDPGHSSLTEEERGPVVDGNFVYVHTKAGKKRSSPLKHVKGKNAEKNKSGDMLATCCLCSLTFRFLSGLKVHMANCHFSEEVDALWKDKSKPCPKCKTYKITQAVSSKRCALKHLSGKHDALMEVVPTNVREHLLKIKKLFQNRRSSQGCSQLAEMKESPPRTGQGSFDNPATSPELPADGDNKEAMVVISREDQKVIEVFKEFRMGSLGQGSFTCWICQAGKATLRELRDHLAVTHFIDQVLSGWGGSAACPSCPKEIQKKTGLRQAMALHLSRMHNRLQEVVPADVLALHGGLLLPAEKEKVGDPRFRCCLCQAPNRCAGNLRRHLVVMHFRAAILEGSWDGGMGCGVCGAAFKPDTPARLERAVACHLGIVHGRLAEVAPPAVRKQLEFLGVGSGNRVGKLEESFLNESSSL